MKWKRSISGDKSKVDNKRERGKKRKDSWWLSVKGYMAFEVNTWKKLVFGGF